MQVTDHCNNVKYCSDMLTRIRATYTTYQNLSVLHIHIQTSIQLPADKLD